MEIKKLKDVNNGTRVVGVYVIMSIEKRTTKTDKPYADLLFGDSTGVSTGKWWDIQSHDDLESFYPGCLVKIESEVDRYQNAIQLTVKKMRPVTEKDGLNIDDYVQSAPFSSDEMIGVLKEYLTKIEDSVYRKVAIEMVRQKIEKLKYYPAAMKNHHAVKGGLLYHTISMVRLAEQVAILYPFLNKDLLFVGVIIHDLEKTEEMLSSTIGIVEDYTVDGKLLGHIVMGANKVKSVAEEAGATEEQVKLLMHIVLSHHGKKEYGSPVPPLIPEAEALHHIDNLDARMNMFMSALEGLEPGDFSDRIFALENRQVYKAKN